MKKFKEKKFNLPAGEASIWTLKGISPKNIEEHLKLYAGYVKNTNLIIEKIFEYKNDLENNVFILGELQRRFGFEFNGMRNHEYFFASLENGPKPINKESELNKKIEKEWGSLENFLAYFKFVAITRGIGWTILYYDKINDELIIAWMDEHHIGQLNGLSPILCLDMWEHAFVADYQPSGKKQYIEDFFVNLNWEVIEENFKKAQ